MRFNPFYRVNGSRGAPMGRRSDHMAARAWTDATRLCAQRQRGSDGGAYDQGGAYWGTGGRDGPVWAVWEHGKGDAGVMYVRAHNRQQAIERARA